MEVGYNLTVIQEKTKVRKKPWTRKQKIAAIVPVAAVALSLIGNEVHRGFIRNKPTAIRHYPETPAQQVTPPPSNPQSQPAIAPTKHVPQKTKTHVKGNSNVAGNNVPGDDNVLGNSNQTAPRAIAPNGIAITGGNVENPTVNNNFGPPSVELRWSLEDYPETNLPFKYVKVVLLQTNTYYSPVRIVVYCDVEVEDVAMMGVAMNSIMKPMNDKKSWYLMIPSQPISPGLPMRLRVGGSQPFDVIRVDRVQ